MRALVDSPIARTVVCMFDCDHVVACSNDTADVYHTFFALCGLSFLGVPGLAQVGAACCCACNVA
jgi:hypothetical protein